ncbi:DsbA family protein [Brachybacterium alimentarium]|uniref:DsbA family protein n=1 Tax=Brachybacterium alimentarium TaxID=47845 RepID=UPI003FD54CB6
MADSRTVLLASGDGEIGERMPDPQTTDGTPGGPTSGPRGERPRWLVPVIIVAVVALLIGAVLWIGGDDEPERSGDSATTGEVTEHPGAVEHPDEVAQPDLSDEEARDPDDLLAEGPVDAPVALVVFTDFQCPFCAQWSDDTLPTLREYVDRGDLRIEWRDVNVYGEDSERAARAALAAAKQDTLEEYHAALFPDGEIREPQELSEGALVDLAGELGMDVDQFREDLNSDEVAQTIDENAQQGIELGAMSTPAFLLDGTPLAGAQPTEVFTDALDEALAEAEG